MARGEELVRILSTQGDGEGRGLGYELLQEIFKGYPIRKLRRLLHSTQPSAVDDGAWIISELGVNATPLRSEFSLLLEHPLKGVRFWGLDAILVATTNRDGPLIAKATSLIDDPERAVRWKALGFLAKAKRDHLSAGITHLADDRLRSLTTWLRDQLADPRGGAEILPRLDDTHRVVRLFGAAAAARVAQSDRLPLERAATSSDEEIRLFAKTELDLLAKRSRARDRHRDPGLR